MSGDESVSFSLRELEELERERIAREHRERAEREAAAARAREDERRREHEAMRAEEAAREAARRREIEELARREAMQKALVEQTRIEVEARARADEAERERRHELELARLRAGGPRDRPIGAVLASALVSAAVVLTGAVVIHFALIRPATDARIAELVVGSVRSEDRAAELERETTEQAKTIEALRAELGRERARTLDASPRTPPSPPTTKKPGRHAPGATSPATRPPVQGPDCLKGDPLCPTIR